MRGLKGRRILVAGGGNGIGRAVAIRLAEEGAALLIAGIDETALPEAARLCEAAAARAGSGATIATQLYDLGDAASIARLVAACRERLGGLDGVALLSADTRLSIMRADLPVSDADPAIWDRVLRINLTGNMLLIQSALRLLKEAGGGSIVTTSSNSAYLGRPSIPAFAASKAGLNALTRHVARIGGPDNIRCNGVSPGLAMDPDRELPDPAVKDAVLKEQALKRIGRNSDVAATIAFLLSDDAEWITGQMISVNGGLTFRD